MYFNPTTNYLEQKRTTGKASAKVFYGALAVNFLLQLITVNIGLGDVPMFLAASSYIIISLLLPIDLLICFIAATFVFDLGLANFAIGGITTGGLNLFKSLFPISILLIKTRNLKQGALLNVTLGYKVFIISLTLFFAYTYSLSYGIKFYLQMVMPYMLSLGLVACSRNHLKKLIEYMSTGLIVVAILTLFLDKVLGLGFGGQEAELIENTGYAFTLGGIGFGFCAAILFIIDFNLYLAKLSQRYAVLKLVLYIFIILLGGSRTSVAALAIGMLTTIIVQRAFRLRLFLIPLTLLILFFAEPVQEIIKNTRIYESIEGLQEGKQTHEMDSGREYIWATALKVIEQNPIIGQGMGGELKYIQTHGGIGEDYGGTTLIHNEYLHLMVIGGISILLLFFFWQMHLIRTSFKINDIIDKSILLSCILAFLLSCFFENIFSLYHSAIILWTLVVYGILHSKNIEQTDLLSNGYSYSYTGTI